MKKHIVCLGDSNTHGFCADPRDTADCEFNTVDYMHLTAKGHAILAKALAELVPTLL